MSTWDIRDREGNLVGKIERRPEGGGNGCDPSSGCWLFLCPIINYFLYSHRDTLFQEHLSGPYAWWFEFGIMYFLAGLVASIVLFLLCLIVRLSGEESTLNIPSFIWVILLILSYAWIIFPAITLAALFMSLIWIIIKAFLRL